MGDDNKRIHGRAIIDKINAHILFSLISVGFIFSCLITVTVLAIYTKHIAFILLIVVCILSIRSLFSHMKQVTKIRENLRDKLYSVSDRSYVWDVEETRDRLMARVIQEGICPWSYNKACVDSQNCKCLQQIIALKEINLDPTSKKKVILNARDETT